MTENTYTESDTGLKYLDTQIGSGEIPKKGQKISVHYTGRLEDGRQFDSSLDRGQPLVFTLGVGQVIKGWDEGLSSMHVGGKTETCYSGSFRIRRTWCRRCDSCRCNFTF